MGCVDYIQRDLKFLSKYVKMLEEGRKNSTLRKGRRVPLKMTLPVFEAETNRKVGDAEIIEVRWVKLKDALSSKEILRSEGTSNPEELLEELKAIYGDISLEEWFTFFKFKYIKAQP